MASASQSLSLWCFLFFFLLAVPTRSSSQGLVAPVQKDHTTLQYIVSVYLKTPLQLTNLLLHLGGRFTWLDCYTNYTSSTYRQIHCNNFTNCDPVNCLACGNCFDRPLSPTCANDTCDYFPENPVTRASGLENALVDSLGLPVVYPNGTGSNHIQVMPNFNFSCSKPDLLKGLAKGVTGLAALGYTSLSLPVQVSEALSLPRYFAVCLSGSRSSPGVAFFGTRGPYRFHTGIDPSENLIYTPILVNPYGDTVISYSLGPSAEYFIGVSAIKVNGKPVPLNSTLLKIDQNSGSGGSKLSTVAPYTVLHSSIYKALMAAFLRESSAMNLTAAQAVKPFSVCFPTKDLNSTRVGPAVPTIDLVLQSEDVVWRIFGANSMVGIKRKNVDVWCLGVVDGGANARTPIVVGGLQLEDNFLQFDFGSMRLGFSSSLLLKDTNCANFEF